MGNLSAYVSTGFGLMLSLNIVAQSVERDGCYAPPELSFQVRSGTLVHCIAPLANGSLTTIVLEPGMEVQFDVHGSGLLCWAALSVSMEGTLLDSCTAFLCNTTYSAPGTYRLIGYAHGSTRTAEVTVAHGPVCKISSQLSISAMLAGAFDPVAGRMRSDLSRNGLLPSTEPYSDLGYVHPSCGGESFEPWIADTSVVDPIVDWVRVELRDPSTDSVIIARNALILGSGKVRPHSGEASLTINAEIGTYQVILRHRNHLSACSMPLHYPFQFSALSMRHDTYLMDTEADTRIPMGNTRALRQGNARLDAGSQRISYTGSNNDRDPILRRIGGSSPNATVNGYFNEDLNLDGVVKYTGANNDRDLILQALGGMNVTAVVEE